MVNGYLMKEKQSSPAMRSHVSFLIRRDQSCTCVHMSKTKLTQWVFMFICIPIYMHIFSHVDIPMNAHVNKEEHMPKERETQGYRRHWKGRRCENDADARLTYKVLKKL